MRSPIASHVPARLQRRGAALLLALTLPWQAFHVAHAAPAAAPVSTPAAAPGTASPVTPATGRLEIGLESGRLTIRMALPLAALVGFAQPPRDRRQRTAVRDAADRLRASPPLIEPDPAGECAPPTARVLSPTIAPALLGEPDEPVEQPRKSNDRQPAEVTLLLAFDCRAPQKLRSLLVRAFDAFPRLAALEASIDTPEGRSGGRLTASRARLHW